MGINEVRAARSARYRRWRTNKARAAHSARRRRRRCSLFTLPALISLYLTFKRLCVCEARAGAALRAASMIKHTVGEFVEYVRPSLVGKST